jgi:hypothetical protein
LLRGELLINRNGPYLLSESKTYEAEERALHEVAIARAQADKARPSQALYPLRAIDDPLNCSIFPKTAEPMNVTKIKNSSMSREDLMACYAGLHKIKIASVSANPKKSWQFEAANNFYTIEITSWKTEADAQAALDEYKTAKAKANSTQIDMIRKGVVTVKDITQGRAQNRDWKVPFEKGPSELTKEAVMKEYADSKSTPHTVKEITPAGNWLWELEVENDEHIAVIIGWASNADARKAEGVYASMPELKYERRRNCTGYVRSSGIGAYGDLSPPALYPFEWAADGRPDKGD